MHALLALLLLTYYILNTANALKGGPTDLTAADRGLIATDVKPVLLAQEGHHYFKGVAQRNFNGNVLGYVTPWNNHGYDVAVRWRAKFTHISPVWYQLRAKEGGSGFKLTGGHDVDQGWIAKLREPVEQEGECSSEGAGPETCSSSTADADQGPPLIVPRVIFELAPQDLVKVLQQPTDAIDMIVAEIQKQGLDGLVLEGWLQWAAMGVFQQEPFTQAVIAMITQLAGALHTAGKVLVLAIPPVVPSTPERPGAELEHMQQLSKHVDGFSIMTYDYSASGPGPNAPLPWQEENVKDLMSKSSTGTTVAAAQVLMGVPFYGYDFSKPDQASSSKGSSKKRAAASNSPATANPIMGEAYLSVLRRLKPKLKWEEQHAEHRIKYKESGMRHTVYYPTPAALAARIQLAEQLGVGLSIWELGQGIDSFMDLL